MSKKKSGKFKHFKRNLIYTLKNPFFYIWILVGIIIILATLEVFKTETQTESGIETLFDSVWFTLVTVFAGYFDYCVKSVGGRTAALILLIFGMALLSVITGKIASLFTSAQIKNDKGLRKLKKMIIIFYNFLLHP